MEKKVDFVRAEVAVMRSRAAVCEALNGGTVSMRRSGKTYLPIEPGETEEAYLSRLNKTTLFPAFRDSVDALVGKPLGSPIVVNDAPAGIEAALENVDLTGQDLDTWAKAVFKRGLSDGIVWALVDHPVMQPGATLAQERAAGVRPYVVELPLARVIGWKTELVGGSYKLTEFRFETLVEEPDGWDVRLVPEIRVLRPGAWEAYRQDERKEWILVQEGTTSLDVIPVAAFAPGRTGYFTALPPLEDLAWLNVTHWQSSSDQRHVLHVARVPLLGADEDVRSDTKAPVVVGPNRLVVGLKNLRFVEHTGAAIDAGRQDLVDLQEQMRLVAGKVMTRQAGGDKSATEASLESKDGGSKLRSWCWQFQDFLEEVLLLMCLWTGDKAEPEVVVSTDWDDLVDPAMFATILQARQAGLISQETFLWNAQRAELLPPDVSIDDEKAALDAEGPMSMGLADPMASAGGSKPKPKPAQSPAED